MWAAQPKMSGWLTPEEIPAGTVCRILRIPDHPNWTAPVTGALLSLAQAWNWEKFGALTPEETADRFAQMLNEYQDAGLSNCMIGVVFPYATTNPPNGALPCDGSNFSREDYPALYAALDPSFIVDSDNFVTPNLAGRVVVGAGEGSGLSPYSVGQIGGEENHALTSSENGTHSHVDLGHVHAYQPPGISGLALAPGELPVTLPNIVPSVTGSASANIQSSGEGSPHNNLQPYQALKYGIWWR